MSRADAENPHRRSRFPHQNIVLRKCRAFLQRSACQRKLDRVIKAITLFDETYVSERIPPSLLP
jgi:hypothetical protein